LRFIVQKVLHSLADLMIDSDLSLKEFEDIAKRAYVVVASNRATRASGTVNHSQVAAITGLSRAEVKGLLAPHVPVPAVTNPSRAARVIDGWTNDPRFRRRDGEARVLRLTEGTYSFKELVRLYAGDIPPKAILDRLKRLRLVRVTPDTRSPAARVHLIQKAPSSSLNAEAADVLGHLSRALNTASTGQIPRVASARLTAKDSPQLAAIARAVIERRDAFLSGLTSSFSESPRGGPFIEILVSIARSEQEAGPAQSPAKRSCRKGAPK
jgi:hypothetical protein